MGFGIFFVLGSLLCGCSSPKYTQQYPSELPTLEALKVYLQITKDAESDLLVRRYPLSDFQILHANDPDDVKLYCQSPIHIDADLKVDLAFVEVKDQHFWYQGSQLDHLDDYGHYWNYSLLGDAAGQMFSTYEDARYLGFEILSLNNCLKSLKMGLILDEMFWFSYRRSLDRSTGIERIFDTVYLMRSPTGIEEVGYVWALTFPQLTIGGAR